MSKEKKEKKSLSITIDPEVNQILDDKSINKSKLINSLLKKYLKKISDKK